MSTWTTSPWVVDHRDQIRFALHVFPIDTPIDPSDHLLAAGRLAEELGFDAFFTGDHPGWGLDCWMHLAALSAVTTRIRLGTMVSCIYYRSPLLTARLAADLDNLSHGRLILGLGIGWDENEFANLGITLPPVTERQAALEETIAIIRGAWGPEPFTFEGVHVRARDAHIVPPPVQKPAPPLLIAGGGERVTLRQVAQHADACNFIATDVAGGVRTPEAIRHKLTVLARHCQALNRPFDTVLCTHTTGWLILAPDGARLRAKERRYFPKGIASRFGGPWRDFAVTATPEQAVQYYQDLANAGVQYFVVGLLDATDQETIHLLAAEVIPNLMHGKRVSIAS